MNRRKRITAIPAVFLVICTLLLVWADHRFTGELTDQTLADRWAQDGSFSQVSCFFQSGSGLTEDALTPLRYQLNTALQNAGIGIDSDEDDTAGRNLVDAYSAIGTLSIASTRASTDARAVGVGGDFFLFHPMTLLSGAYFDGDDVNPDGVILDEDIAWKLFGSYNIVGMEVTIGDCVYPVRGVVRRSTGAFSAAAEEDTPTIYVAFDILAGDTEGMQIDAYELLIKSPVTGFGATTLTDSLGLSESSYEIVENTTRFSVSHRMEIIKEFGVRSMRVNGMALPYWENRARAYEDAAALLLVLEGLLLVYPAIRLLALLVLFFRRCRRFSVRTACEQLTDWVKGKIR